MTTIEETLSKTTLKDILPVLSLDCKKTLVLDLQRVVEGLKNQESHALREVYRSLKSDYERETKRLEHLESELDLS
jgi:hypothetical protein